MDADVPVRPRVVVAAKRGSSRSTLRRLVELEWAWSVVGEASDGLEAFRLCRVHGADVLIADAAIEELDITTLEAALGDDAETVVVSLLDLPHEHAMVRGPAVLKGVPSAHARSVIERALQSRPSTR